MFTSHQTQQKDSDSEEFADARDLDDHLSQMHLDTTSIGLYADRCRDLFFICFVLCCVCVCMCERVRALSRTVFENTRVLIGRSSEFCPSRPGFGPTTDFRAARNHAPAKCWFLFRSHARIHTCTQAHVHARTHARTQKVPRFLQLCH